MRIGRVVIARVLRTCNRNRIGGNNIHRVINGRIATCAFLSETNTVNKSLNASTRSFRGIAQDGLVSLAVGKDFSITGPNVCAGARCGNISLEFIFKSIANRIFGRSLCNSYIRHSYYFHRITARGGTIGILLTNTDKVLVFRCCRSNCQRIVVFSIDNGSIARNLIPLVGNIISGEVADVCSESNISAGADAVLIMSDLYIDRVIHIHIEGI